MPKVNCAVIGCSNSTYVLNKWKNETCDIHSLKKSDCSCERPFLLYCFPSILKNNEQRKSWIRSMKREGENKTVWQPKDSDRVCSVHFVDGAPTAKNPLPTLNMGYEIVKKKSRREILRMPPSKKKRLNKENTNFDIVGNNKNIQLETKNYIANEHNYCKLENTYTCFTCYDKKQLIQSLINKINKMSITIKQTKKKEIVSSFPSAFSWKKIKTDAKMKFYTGMTSIALFNAVFLLMEPYLSHISYWRSPYYYKNQTTNKSKLSKRKASLFKKLSHRDEFLLTLMRLRLGLLNEDLADRFGISTTLCSRTFTTWIRLISKVLGTALVVWLPRESIRDNLSNAFIKAGNKKCRVILDCAEVFIEHPKSLVSQAATWSDYKHHNTIKFLVGISPVGFITFISHCYGGRASDKFIVNDSGFLELLERDDEVMADRGFQIQEELLFKYCKLVVPPGARVKSQLTTAECEKTKTIANL